MTRELDIILFGATGFTGKHAIPLISKFAKERNLKWGIAGRSEQKLKDLLKECERKIGTSLNVPLISADVQQEKTLNAMARRTRIIINCCGPYYYFGEPVIKACVQEGTHHVDVSGEAQYMEKMQIKYHDEAKRKGIYIISACGFDSIPADLGTVLLQEKFDGTLNSVEAYVDLGKEGSPGSGIVAVNSGTWKSMICMFQYANEIKALRKQLFPKRLPRFEPHLPLKLHPRKIDLLKGWIVPFLGPDRTVIKRSQYYFYENDSKRPIQAETYMVINSFIRLLTMALFGSIFLVFSQFEFGRNLLLKYPKIFTGGYIDREPPNEEEVKKDRFKFTLYGEGWNETLPDANHEFSIPPNKNICLEVTGSNPAYGATCVCLVLAAITVITETEKMPPRGGVYPPGYAFAKTSLIEQLNENGVKFEIRQC